MADQEIRPPHSSAGKCVYLLDAHQLARRGLRQLMEANGIRISGESGSAREAIRQIPALRPDLVILADDLPDGSGAVVASAIAAAAPTIRCLLTTGDADESVLIGSILAGAWGCLSKQDDNSEQLRLIRRALGGHRAYSSLFQPAPTDTVAGQGLPGEGSSTLTKQEVDAAIGVGRGLSTREISHQMSLGEAAVKDLVSSVLTKLNMAGTAQPAVSSPDAARPAEAASANRTGLYSSPSRL